MKTAGKRKETSIDFHASAEKLRTGGEFNDAMLKAAGHIALFPKGVYHYKTHQQANEHWQAQSVKEVVRRNTK